METDETSKKIIVLIICTILLFLVAFIGCNGNRSIARIPEDTEYMKEIRWYDETLRAYNHLLHRVWIDHPNYVEDVLVETDEFVELDSLLNGHWADTFEFYSKRDSIDYHNNWWNK